MAYFKYTPHTKYDIRCEDTQGGAPWDAVSICPKTVSRGPKSVSGCPESVSRCPHFFQAHIVTATSSISQLQALATGICSIQILIFVISMLSSGTWYGVLGSPGGVSRCPSTVYIENFFWISVLLIIGDTFLKIPIFCSNIPPWMLYPYVSSKCFISKFKYTSYVREGFNFSVSRCPSLPL